MGEEKKKETPTAPSEQFEEAFGGIGCLVVDCGFCNRTHFATYNRSGDYDPGEEEALEAKQEKAPDGYISHDYSSVGVGYIGGIQYVHGCPCNEARKYEEFIWDHKAEIVNYLEKMSKAVLEEAQRDKDIADRGRKALEGGRLMDKLKEIKARWNSTPTQASRQEFEDFSWPVAEMERERIRYETLQGNLRVEMEKHESQLTAERARYKALVADAKTLVKQLDENAELVDRGLKWEPDSIEVRCGDIEDLKSDLAALDKEEGTDGG